MPYKDPERQKAFQHEYYLKRRALRQARSNSVKPAAPMPAGPPLKALIARIEDKMEPLKSAVQANVACWVQQPWRSKPERIGVDVLQGILTTLKVLSARVEALERELNKGEIFGGQ